MRTRSFAPTDLIRLTLGLALAVGGTVIARVAQQTIEGIEQDILTAFSRLPDKVEHPILSGAQLVTALIPVTILVVLLVRRRWKVAGILVLTGAVASVAMQFVVELAIDRDIEHILDQVRAGSCALRCSNRFSSPTMMASLRCQIGRASATS